LSQILMVNESESLSGYSPQSFRSWKETAGSFGTCSEETSTGLVFSNHGQDTRFKGPVEVAETVSATYGTGGNNQPFVVEHFRKAYGICGKYSNSMLSNNPNSGFYEADTARTIDTSNQSPCKNQGGIVVLEGNGSRPSHHGDGYKESETMYTLNCTENHAVSYGIGRPAMNQGYNARFSFQIEEEKSPTLVASGAGGIAHPKYSTSKNSHHTVAEKEKANTLVASDYKDPPVVNDSTPEIEYIVRRLTPQECARLQGFPDQWCSDLASENPTEEEIDRWVAIFEEYQKAVKPESRPKSRKMVQKWLQDPYRDAAEYRLWGNGICLNVAVFVLAGIVWADL